MVKVSTMKAKGYLICCLVLILAGCSKKKYEPQLIEPGVGIGEVKFGMSVKEVKEILGKPDQESDYFLVFNRFGLSIETENGVVNGILCMDATDSVPDMKACEARTKEGIGIGSTKEEVLAAYGEPTLSEPLRLKYEQLGACFLLSEESKVNNMLFDELK